MTVRIESARSSDAAEMAAVQVEGLQVAYHGLVPDEIMGSSSVPGRARQWRAWLRRRHARTCVARLDGQLAGFVAVHPAPREGESRRSVEVAALFVAPAHWGKGIATALMGQILTEAEADGAGEIVLWVLESNERARRFYAAQGFGADGGTRVFTESSDGPLRELRYRRTMAGAGTA